ncbi:MAG: hypothetical protein EBU46_00915 [Nitrosomonadaceae bacterium]|nr:hypothetical protein [Nitrosomonadaceae bacterium]
MTNKPNALPNYLGEVKSFQKKQPRQAAQLKQAFDQGFFKAAEEVGVDAVTANNIYKFANGSGWAPTMLGAIPGALTGGLAGYLAPSEEESDASLIDPKIRNMLLGGAAGGLGGGMLGNAAGSVGYEHGVRDLLIPQPAR